MNKIHVWKALARSVVLESVRRKDLWVVAILGFVILLASGTIGFFGTQGLESMMKDLAGHVLGAFSTILAVVTASRLIPDEIKNRTLYPLISRPITRFDLLFGKLLGAIAVSWISFLILCGLTAVALVMFRVQFEPIMAQYVLAKMMGLVVICSFTMMMSLFMTPSAAMTMSFVVLFGSGMIVQALVMASETVDPLTRTGFQVINALLPQTNLFDLSSRAAHDGWGPVAPWVIGSLALYMLAYSASTLSLGWAKFRKQAV